VILVLLLPLAAMLLVGLAAAVLAGAPQAARAVGAIGMCAASVGGLAAAIAALVLGDASSLALPWNAAIGASFSVAFDPLTGFFLLPIYGLSAVCAVFGAGYLSHAHHGRGVAAHWLFYGLLVSSMALVVMARNAVLFLVAWEIMSLSSWQLVTFEHEREETRQAGITYLVATQIGTAFLLVMFLVLGTGSVSDAGGAGGAAGGAAGSLDFAQLGASGRAASAVFLLALVGFGTKAGIVPLHVWLPEAHPAAPSHVSALMSGVMIKTGIYGIVRVLSFIGAPPAWWGWTLVLIGAVSGVVGVLFALAQHDIKRLLAYHSVENIGIICLGLGVGLLGISFGSTTVAFLGFAGGLLHVLNHALFKGLLFLGAGSASHAAGTREIDRLGGLMRRMPLTGAAFLVGAAAICGLPPLNGFVSELLVFLGAYGAASAGPAAPAAAAAIVVAALAFIGGLAAACFTKAFGISFLGEPRTPAAAAAVEAGPSMTVPVLILAGACAGIGLLGFVAVSFIAPLAGAVAGIDTAAALAIQEAAGAGLVKVSLVAGVLAALVLGLVILRAALLSRRTVRSAGTWDCGYTLPDARMQYTSSSFAQPLTGMFRLGTHRHWTPISVPFPERAEFSSHTPDVFSQGVFRPAFAGIGALLSRMRWLQHGRLQLYVLYVAATLLVLLMWKLG
jgi:formate hydrogenlyase subunit 3/multisubunit Na+/H+ antiporter MnhD subunit